MGTLVARILTAQNLEKLDNRLDFIILNSHPLPRPVNKVIAFKHYNRAASSSSDAPSIKKIPINTRSTYTRQLRTLLGN